jgi:hypothetical protein
MISSNIQTVVLSSESGGGPPASTGVQSVSIPAGFDRLVISIPSQPVYMAFFEADLDNPYRRFTIAQATSGGNYLIIPNPKGLGTLYFELDTSGGVLGEVVLSVMVL